MVGNQFIFADGSTGTITAFSSATSLTLDTSQTVSSQNYTIHHVGFQVTSGGDAVVRNTSTTAFQVQASDGTVLLSADTTNMKVTVEELVVNTHLTVDGHFITGGSTPSVSAASCGSATISGNDISGTVTFTGNGGGCPGGFTPIFTVTFDDSYASTPRVILTPNNSNAGSQYTAFVSGASTTGFGLALYSAMAGNTNTFEWNYLVVQ
jgi:hypothetical protein